MKSPIHHHLEAVRFGLIDCLLDCRLGLAVRLLGVPWGHHMPLE